VTSEGRGLVALTGGTGFLGRYLVRALEQAGWRVRLLSRRPRRDRIETVVGSLADAEALDRLVAGADAVVHAAGAIKALSRAEFMRVNRDGSLALAEAIRRAGRPMRVVVVSSMAARASELSDYAASKRAGEAAFADFPDRIVLRPTAVYGPGDRETAVFFNAARGLALPVPRCPGACVTAIHARDAAGAVAALVPPGPHGEVFELTDRNFSGLSWRELAAKLLNVTGGKARIVELPAAVFRAIALASVAKAHLTGRAEILTLGKVRELFHADWSSAGERQPPASLWQPSIELDEGLAETVRWLTREPAAGSRQ
jgi:nucleoside-diphosphate-sugar epimerase